MKPSSRTSTRHFVLLLPVLLLLGAGASQLSPQDPGKKGTQELSSLTTQTTRSLPELNLSTFPPPSPDEEVLAFDTRQHQWLPALVKDVAPGGELLFQDRLFRLHGQTGILELVPEVEVSRLQEADRPYDPENYRDPQASDVVWVIGEEPRHAVLSTVRPGESFAFQGRVFRTKSNPGTGALLYAYTGQVFNRVTQTFQRTTDTVIDLTLRNQTSGQESVITGTPEHPFFVPAINEYVPMGKLSPGTLLLTQDGTESIVVKSQSRKGDFEVFNLEVESSHNYFVSAQGEKTGVLVHNTCSWAELKSRLNASPYKPTQSLRRMDIEKIETMAQQMKDGNFDWSKIKEYDKIKVSADGLVVDGHHRYIAAHKAGVEIPADQIIYLQSNSLRAPYKWDDVLPND